MEWTISMATAAIPGLSSGGAARDSPAKEKLVGRTPLPLFFLRARKLRSVRALASRAFLFAFSLLALLLLSRRVSPHYSSVSASPRGGYTVLINTWKRNSLFSRKLWLIMHLVAGLMQYVWFELNEEDNLNNRFKPIEDLKNDAIFSVDDDVIVPCPTLDFAFTVWQSASDTMVGFVPRSHWLGRKHFATQKDGLVYYTYGGWWSVWWMGRYSMVLSKAAFFHRKYLDLYTNKMPSSIHDYVTRERNCEDIAMSLLVANASGAPPIWVKGNLYEIGDFSFKEAWFHLSDEYPIKYEAERLPPPIVADLNGDGKKEVLVATHDAKIQVLEPHSRRVDEGFSEAQVLAEVSLLPDKIRVASGRRPVAMATGVINRFYKRGEIQKQVLVVVTSGWSVMCFDHNLKKLWENNLQIAISISNYTLKHGDSGLVIVGGRMEMQHHSTMDLFEETFASEKSSDSQRRSANENESSGDSQTVDLRHFAFFAFAGQSGSLRWSRKNENIEAHSSDASQLIPQHNYKLDVHSLNSRHPGEFECREFRESILGVMPHYWDRREDTRFELAHFRRHKRKSLKKMPGKVTNNPFHTPVENHPPGKDPSNKIATIIGKAANYAGSAKSNKVGSLFLGKGVNDTFLYLCRECTISQIHHQSYFRLWWVPNVVVAHQKEGIEAVHLASVALRICKLHLPEGGLHADINGDGVLDHVQVVGGNGAEQAVVSGSMEVLKPCWAVATSGVPVREQLFNASICHHTHFGFFHHGDFARNFGRNVDAGLLEVASPILIHTDDGPKHRKRSHGDVVFLTNRGEVTSYSPSLHGHDAIWRWQLLTGATWSNLPSPSGMMEAMVVPTLKAFSLGKYSKQEVIIAAGDQEAVVISPGGSILTTFDLPSPPTHTLILEDFSGDGLTDIIVVSSSGTYGYVQMRQPGALFFSTLVGCLIVIIAVIFVSQHLNSVNKGKPRASTDHR
ncbi:hypothetical protein J5N97_025401 [Dioscorea zingiberensis]|uniref:Glycosyl transferase 64 domain-containing protein n=1 Tax=Dioscorea zingiberensis TaxID=325984 RepID=A0A9D5C8M8_9LILI|nr:hypothetical protein J5N97_025401 [Dioscorea zingiberensis]